MGPLLPVLQVADYIDVRVEVLPGAPGVDGFSFGSNLFDQIAQHFHFSIGVRLSALDACRQIGIQGLEEEDQGVAIGQAVKVVVQEGILVPPDFPAIPFQFHDGAGPGAGIAALAASPGTDGARQQVAVVQEIAVTQTLRVIPLVAKPAYHVNQVDMIVAVGS